MKNSLDRDEWLVYVNLTEEVAKRSEARPYIYILIIPILHLPKSPSQMYQIYAIAQLVHVESLTW